MRYLYGPWVMRSMGVGLLYYGLGRVSVVVGDAVHYVRARSIGDAAHLMPSFWPYN